MKNLKFTMIEWMIKYIDIRNITNVDFKVKHVYVKNQ